MQVGTAIVAAAAILAVGAISTAAILTVVPRYLLAQTSPTPHNGPTAQASPTGLKTSPQPYPPLTIDPSLNFAGGDFVTGTGFNDCNMHLNFAATSKRDGTGAVGKFIMTVVPTPNCGGQSSSPRLASWIKGRSRGGLSSIEQSNWIPGRRRRFRAIVSIHACLRTLRPAMARA